MFVGVVVVFVVAVLEGSTVTEVVFTSVAPIKKSLLLNEESVIKMITDKMQSAKLNK